MLKHDNECCEHNKACLWGVGSNMPGYMPDSEVSHFGTWSEAVTALLYDARVAADQMFEHGANDDELAVADSATASLASFLKAATNEPEASVRVGPYIYWLTKI